MNRIIGIFWFLTISVGIMGQTDNGFCDIAGNWDQFIICDEPLPDSLSSVLVVSNRPFTMDHPENVYFPNEVANFRRVTYLEVACSNNKWLVHPLKDFDHGMENLEKGKDILVYIHGHGKDFPYSVQRALKIQDRYGVSVILFDWPSKNNNFNKSLVRVRQCGENFYNLLLQLKDYKLHKLNHESHISILAHSLGNYFLSHFVVNGSWQYQNDAFIENIIFNAPAIRSKEHGKVISQIKFARNKYVILNANDKILRGAHLLTSGKMLGNVVIEPLAKDTEYIHFTSIAGKEHNYFAGYQDFENDNPAVYPFYYQLIHCQKKRIE